jgi:predicted permease
MPGVQSAAEVHIVPISGSGWNDRVWAEGDRDKPKVSWFNRVSPGYFRTMNTPILAGRDFSYRDTPGSPRVAIVNEMFAKKFFGGANPLGRVFVVEGSAGHADDRYEVVGLVRNTKYQQVREDFEAIIYLSQTQDDDPGPGATYVLRASSISGVLMHAIKAAVAEVDPGMDLQFTILTKQVEDSLLRDRLMATLGGAFGLLAGILATIGLYGVISYMVARRRNEIGIRVALGADRVGVVRLVLREAAILLAFGLPIGAGLALWAGRTAGSLLFGLKPNDPPTLIGAMLLLGGVAVVASLGPARRAARLDPMQALRED